MARKSITSAKQARRCPSHSFPITPALDELEIKRQAKIFKALADETRLKILSLLTEGKFCVCDITEALNIPQPTVSHHLGILVSAGLISNHREGRWAYYSFEPKMFKRYKVSSRAGFLLAELRR